MNWKLILVSWIIGIGSVASAYPKPIAIGYYSFWSPEKGVTVGQIPEGHLTHIIYAFVEIDETGRCALAKVEAEKKGESEFQKLSLYRRSHVDVKILFSVGGWKQSGRFSLIAKSKESRSQFVSSCLSLMEENHFDGIDLDWEYPVKGGLTANIRSQDDKKNFGELIKEFKTKNKSILLTIDAGASAWQMENLPLDEIRELADWVNVMAYDFASGSQVEASFHSNLLRGRELWSADDAVRIYLKAGVPANKIVLGIPLYGHKWTEVPSDKNGLHQKSLLKADKLKEIQLSQTKIEELRGFKEYWNETAKASWIYDSDTKVFISLESPRAIQEKLKYVKAHGLLGYAFWELADDGPKWTLLKSTQSRK